MSIQISETLIDDIDGLEITDTSTLITLSIEGNRKDFRNIDNYTAYGNNLLQKQTDATNAVLAQDQQAVI